MVLPAQEVNVALLDSGAFETGKIQFGREYVRRKTDLLPMAKDLFDSLELIRSSVTGTITYLDK